MVLHVDPPSKLTGSRVQEGIHVEGSGEFKLLSQGSVGSVAS